MLVFSILGAALGDPAAISQPQGCTSGTAPARGNSPSQQCQGSPALSKGSTAGGHSPQHTHVPHNLLKEQLPSLKTNHPPCRLTVLIGHCCHLAIRVSSVWRSLEPICFLPAAQPEAGINTSLLLAASAETFVNFHRVFLFFSNRWQNTL